MGREKHAKAAESKVMMWTVAVEQAIPKKGSFTDIAYLIADVT
jgi:hypothetical protein